MTAPRDPERLITAFLADGPTELPDRAYDAVRSAIDRTRQRVVVGPWRTPDMNAFVKLAIGATAVVVASLVGISLLNGGTVPRIGGPGVSPSPSPSPSLRLAPPTAGALDVGTYLLDGPSFTRRPFTFSVPEGWRRDDGNFIVKGTANAATVAFEGNGVTMATWIVTHVYGDSCHWQGTLRETGSPIDLITALHEQTGHDTVVMHFDGQFLVGGFPATGFEFSVPADFDASSCDSGVIRLWPDAGPNEKYGLPIVPGQITTVYVVEVGGQAQLIVAARKVDSSPADVDELQQVIASIDFQ